MSNQMLLPQRIDALIDELVLVRNAIAEKDLAPEESVPAAPASDEEISLNVSGTDDLHVRDPSLFAKMKKYYDPERQPFTSTTWFTTAWAGKDVRPLKNVWIDGVEHRRQFAQKMPSNDWYWIMRGCRDVTKKIWEFPILPEGMNRTPEMELAYVAEYEGGLRFPTDRWPTHLKAALDAE